MPTTGKNPAEIIVPLTTEEIKNLWKDNKPWQRACAKFLGKLTATIPKVIDLTS